MKRLIISIIMLSFASGSAFAWQWPSFLRPAKKQAVASREADPAEETKSKKQDTSKSKKFTTDKNKVLEHRELQMLDKDLTIRKNGQNVPPTDSRDVHPSDQF